MSGEEELRVLLFGDEIRSVNLAELARRTGIHRNTLNYYKDHPLMLKTGRLMSIAKAIRLSTPDLMKALDKVAADETGGDS